MADDGKDTGKDKRILGIRFVRCAICDKAIRETEAIEQRGLKLCPEDVDVLDHEGEDQ